MSEPNIILSGEKFEQLKSVLNQHRDFIHTISMPDLVKKSLVCDMQKVTTILGTAKKGVVNG